MHIGLINESDRFSAHDCRAAVAAVAHQLRYDVAPAWDRHVPSIALYARVDNVPLGAHIVLIVEDADIAGALGYHDETPDGRPYARVFVGPVLDNGGTALSGSLSVSAVLSHEVVELFGDPDVNLWADNWPRNEQVAVELCDPVEACAYPIRTRYGEVSVSDFVLPSWFDAIGGQHPFSFTWSVGTPFEIAAGGYLLVRSEGKVGDRWGLKVTQRFGATPTGEPFTISSARYATKTHHASRTWLRKNLTTEAPTK